MCILDEQGDWCHTWFTGYIQSNTKIIKSWGPDLIRQGYKGRQLRNCQRFTNSFVLSICALLNIKTTESSHYENILLMVNGMTNSLRKVDIRSATEMSRMWILE